MSTAQAWVSIGLCARQVRELRSRGAEWARHRGRRPKVEARRHQGRRPAGAAAFAVRSAQHVLHVLNGTAAPLRCGDSVLRMRRGMPCLQRGIQTLVGVKLLGA